MNGQRIKLRNYFPEKDLYIETNPDFNQCGRIKHFDVSLFHAYNFVKENNTKSCHIEGIWHF